jgi:uncharacterized lipoprotein YmbA
MMPRFSFRFPLVAGLALALAACASSEPIHFYLLSPRVQTAVGAARVSSIGIRPAELPDYLGRAEIVTRGQDNRLEVNDLDRWGEQLGVLVTRTLANTLQAALPGADIVTLPTDLQPPPTRLLNLVIDRFESDASGVVTLSGRWQLIDSRDNRPTAGARILITEKAAAGTTGGPSKNEIADTMSRALGRLASDIALAAR